MANRSTFIYKESRMKMEKINGTYTNHLVFKMKDLLDCDKWLVVHAICSLGVHPYTIRIDYLVV